MIFLYFRFSIVPQILASKMTSESDNPNNVEADFVIDQRKTDWVQSFFRHMPRSQVSVFELFSFKDDLETSEASVISDQNFSTTDDLEEVFFSTTNARIVQFAGIKPKDVVPGKKKKKLRWRDQTGLEPLVDVKEIPSDNKGIKCGSGNKEFLQVKSQVKGSSKKSTGSKEMAMDDIFKIIL